MAQYHGRRVLILLDNASCHGKHETLPVAHNVQILFLPKNTTSRLELLDAGVIEPIKRRYRKHQLERVIHLIEAGVYSYIYSFDLYTAAKTIYDIWGGSTENLLKIV